jgi:hypothetical protein
MSTRLDALLSSNPEHSEGIRALASRDPSGNLKYLDWGAKMLASGQALAHEIADVIDLFHKYAGRRLTGPAPAPAHARYTCRTLRAAIHPDIYTYKPEHLSTLRDGLRKVHRAMEAKRKKRERLYRIEGEVDADIIYESPVLVVRHIRNKQASVHHGLRTKWCISMLQNGYFDDYDAHNATFFFFERKAPLGDEYDKVALMVPRGSGAGWQSPDLTEAFTAVDRRVDMLALAKAYGLEVFEAFLSIHLRSEQYPGSATARVYAGTATVDEVTDVWADLVRSRGPRPHRYAMEISNLIEAVACNDAAPFSLLLDVQKHGPVLVERAWRKMSRGGRSAKTIVTRYRDSIRRTIEAALFLHPNTPPELRETLTKTLRKRHVRVEEIHRVTEGSRVGVQCGAERLGRHGLRRVRRHLRRLTPKRMLARAGVLERRAARMRKTAKRLAQKKRDADAKKRKAKRR